MYGFVLKELDLKPSRKTELNAATAVGVTGQLFSSENSEVVLFLSHRASLEAHFWHRSDYFIIAVARAGSGRHTLVTQPQSAAGISITIPVAVTRVRAEIPISRKAPTT
jgi:hypothetical protein